jgi:hypothetical protein
MLEEILTKQNPYLTKHPVDRYIASILGDRNVVFMDTFHQDYANTRKVLSAAFFKQKLLAVTTIIKEEVLDVIKAS